MFDKRKCSRKVQQARHAVCSFLEAHSDSPEHCNKDSARSASSGKHGYSSPLV